MLGGYHSKSLRYGVQLEPEEKVLRQAAKSSKFFFISFELCTNSSISQILRTCNATSDHCQTSRPDCPRNLGLPRQAPEHDALDWLALHHGAEHLHE